MKRSAIENLVSKETRLEVLWGRPMPSYWKWTDQGGDAWGPTIKLIYDLHIRGGEAFDPPHRHVRNRLLSISQSSGGFVQTEFGITFAWVRGPWKSEGNLQLLKGAPSCSTTLLGFVFPFVTSSTRGSSWLSVKVSSRQAMTRTNTWRQFGRSASGTKSCITWGRITHRIDGRTGRTDSLTTTTLSISSSWSFATSWSHVVQSKTSILTCLG